MIRDMKLLLLGAVIDVLKWMNEPLYHLHATVNWLRIRRIGLLVPLQFEYHEMKRKAGK